MNKAAAFLVDTTCLHCSDDLKADDLGVWKHKDKPKRKYKITRNLDSGVVYGADQTKEDKAMSTHSQGSIIITKIPPNFGEHCFMSMVSTKNIDFM